MSSLYERLGGELGIDVAVFRFYRKVLSDPLLRPFFQAVDMNRQASMQKAFLSMVTGGPNHYSGRDMNHGHAALRDKGMSDAHVSAVIQHLAETLRELGVADADIQAVGQAAEGLRDHVMGRCA